MTLTNDAPGTLKNGIFHFHTSFSVSEINKVNSFAFEQGFRGGNVMAKIMLESCENLFHPLNPCSQLEAAKRLKLFTNLST